MSELTQAQLKEVLSYDPGTGIFVRKSNRKGKRPIGDAGRKNNNYIRITVLGKSYAASQLAWLYMKGYIPKNIKIDHIDRVKYHNWFSNFRLVSNQCNSRNCGNFKNNSSGIKGVSWNEPAKGWAAIIAVNKVNRTIGTHKDFDNAVCARLAAEQCLNWEGCDSCSPAYQYVKEMLGW